MISLIRMLIAIAVAVLLLRSKSGGSFTSQTDDLGDKRDGGFRVQLLEAQLVTGTADQWIVESFMSTDAELRTQPKPAIRKKHKMN